MSPIFLVLCSLFAITTAQVSGSADLGNYPDCSAQCLITRLQMTASLCRNYAPNNLTCLCAGPNRAATAACEKLSCTDTDYQTTQTLAQDLCGPLYTNNTLNPTSVSSAIASATAAATAAVAGKDFLNSNDYPPCARDCQNQVIPMSECKTLSNSSCICNSQTVVQGTGACELANCSMEDRMTTAYLSFKQCAAFGGIGNASEVANQTIATQSSAPVALPPNGTGAVMPFTGGAGAVVVEKGVWMVLGGFAVAWLMV
ncbi:MAG: hypothetical protein Q9168_007673 [Polycauliona sp. 1 TL-2023]